MRKVMFYSMLLIAGLLGSQLIDRADGASQAMKALDFAVGFLTMVCLSFVMIKVGLEFEIDKKRPGQYVWDYVVAFTAAFFPWVLCSAYFIYVMSPHESWLSADLWKESFLAGRFASPTSAGVLFSMLAAAGLATSWVFKKARVLAIFDDLDTILLMIPLKIMMVGMQAQLLAVVLIILALLWAAWKYLHTLHWKTGWTWLLLYSVVISVISELVYFSSIIVDADVPIHLEVLLPAFVFGCILAHPAHEEKADAKPEVHREGLPHTLISACFMVLVGLSMPSISLETLDTFGSPPLITGSGSAMPDGSHLELEAPGAAGIAVGQADPRHGLIVLILHVLAVTILINAGKLFPALCYRNEATSRERLAVAVAMFPRGEVGAGVLFVSLSYGVNSAFITVAALSLAFNLLCTGLFIALVKKLIIPPAAT